MPHLSRTFDITFTGGEPLLAFGLIDRLVSFIKLKSKGLGKSPTFSITTNSSLLNDEIINFLDHNKFSVVVSFDSMAQDLQRKSGSFDLVLGNIKKLMACEGIGLEVNSVFTPDAIAHFSESINLLIDMGIPRIRFSFSHLNPWEEDSVTCFEKELEKVCDYVRLHYQRTGELPLANFTEITRQRIACCSAGQNRFSITPDGELWGCPLFPDYFERFGDRKVAQEYRFGKFVEIRENFHEIYKNIFQNYAQLRMDNCSTSKNECFLCPNIGYCSVCPISSSFSGEPLNKIPDYLCKIQKIKIQMMSELFG